MGCLSLTACALCLLRALGLGRGPPAESMAPWLARHTPTRGSGALPILSRCSGCCRAPLMAGDNVVLPGDPRFPSPT